MFFFFKQKTAYEMRISDWSSDVCSSDLHVSSDPDTLVLITGVVIEFIAAAFLWVYRFSIQQQTYYYRRQIRLHNALLAHRLTGDMTQAKDESVKMIVERLLEDMEGRSEEHTSELQSLMRISYAVFCLNKKKAIYITIITK